MTMKFEAGPDDPPHMHLAAELMNEISGPFNTWVAAMIARKVDPQQFAMAYVAAASVHMNMIAKLMAVPGYKNVAIIRMLQLLHDSATQMEDNDDPRPN